MASKKGSQPIFVSGAACSRSADLLPVFCLPFQLLHLPQAQQPLQHIRTDAPMDPEEIERLKTPGPPVEAPELSPSLRLASLTRREENTVIDMRRKHAYARCAEAMRLFSECSSKYTIGVVWNCKVQKEIMNECLRRANTVDDMDRARSIYVHEKQLHMKEKENKPRTLI
ncbi:hypothetical protein GQ54DRAFT_298183 [Martensiomyces pterosporus]|nr:hypothetical protein GQ54DRAFT_298183 [Martensiomyces pterosporus]